MKNVFVSATCLLAGLFAASATLAGDLSVIVNDAAGKPVSFAVVTFTPNGGAAPSAADKARSFTMAQRNVQFAPYVLAVPVGATVNFPNEDRVNHHVYSFSPVQPFQFPLYGKGKTHTMTFGHEGTIALGCNIHDSMSAYIRVVNTPYYATTDASGRVTLKGLPEVAGNLMVWQPMMDGASHASARAVTIAKANAPQAFSVKVHQMAPMNSAY